MDSVTITTYDSQSMPPSDNHDDAEMTPEDEPEHTDTLPTDVVTEFLTTATNKQTVINTLRSGDNLSSDMDAYLAGYSDAYTDFEKTLETLQERLSEFDPEIRSNNPITCYNCGAELGEEWRAKQKDAKETNTHPADCPECGENPLPPVGASNETGALNK